MDDRMSLRLFNTLTREKELFEPIEEGKVRFYSCGQTIYDDLHIGNARAYVVWDTLTRYLRWKGYDVRHVQNITDVGHLTDDGDQGEDKVEKRARQLDLEPMELVEDQIERYFEDTKALNIKRQDIVPRATGHIQEMIEYTQRIIDNGYAYEKNGNIYFDVDRFSKDYEYGEMAKKDLKSLKEKAEGRVDPDENKKNQYDFALWLNAEGSSHLMRWNAKFDIKNRIIESEGYPGWHLECSVMGQKYLGDLFDIHAGGKDHIFPHHPNERAQCHAASGSGQANYWLHNEFVKWNGEQMSKSTGNFVTVRELIDKGYDGDALRLYINSSHYRSETNFSIEGIENTEKEYRQIKRTVKKIRDREDDFDLNVSKVEDNFEEEMDDDLNTARAKQVLMKFVGEVNSKLEDDHDIDDRVADKLVELFQILGVNIESDISDKECELVETLIELRDEARKNENWKKADFIREKLENIGYEIEDRKNETEWF